MTIGLEQNIIRVWLPKQGVALTVRNTTGPPLRAAPGEFRCAAVECYRRQTTTTDANEQKAVLSFLHYV